MKKKTLERGKKKKLFRRKRTPHLDLIRVTYHLPDHWASEEVHQIPAIHYTGTFLPGFQYAGTFWAVSGALK